MHDQTVPDGFLIVALVSAGGRSWSVLSATVMSPFSNTSYVITNQRAEFMLLH